MATSTRWTAGNTTPCLATRLGYGACVAELLQHGAHVMVFSRTGTHAFFAAMRGGHLVIARTLLHVNPNEALSTTDGRGFLFLHYAVISNDVGFLAELNALRSVDDLIVNACNASLSTPLHIAARYDCDASITWLLDMNAKTDLENEMGERHSSLRSSTASCARSTCSSVPAR